LILGSRDRTIRVWKLEEEKGGVVQEALWSRGVHKVNMQY